MAKNQWAIEIEIIEAKGSTPRDIGASMRVNHKDQIGTIGGGALEWEAITHARKILAGLEQDITQRVALGPKINQCCGGQVTLAFTQIKWTASRAHKKQNIYIFGAGHTGAAIAQQFHLLNWNVHLIDERAEWLHAFKSHSSIQCHQEAMPEQRITSAPPQSVFIITTHSHGLDFALTAEAIKRQDAAYIGMIGSQTKRARFEKWAREAGLCFSDTELDCPMGQKFEAGKAPEIIALNVAHQVIGTILHNEKETSHG